MTVVVGAADAELTDDPRVAVEAVRELLEAGASRRVAVDVVARLADVSRNGLYRSSLTPRD